MIKSEQHELEVLQMHTDADTHSVLTVNVKTMG